MKKIAIIIAAVFMVGCGSNTGTHEKMCEEPQATYAPILNDINTSHITREYDEEEECENVSFEGETERDDHRLSIRYCMRTKDVLGKKLQKPEVSAFIITMNLGRKGATEVFYMEIKIKNETYTIKPSHVINYGSGIFFSIFSPIESSSFANCLNRLAYSNEVDVKTSIMFDNGTHRLMLMEFWQLRNMARSYLKDGGKFE